MTVMGQGPKKGKNKGEEASVYKDTVNLPQTSFGAAASQPRVQPHTDRPRLRAARRRLSPLRRVPRALAGCGAALRAPARCSQR